MNDDLLNDFNEFEVVENDMITTSLDDIEDANQLSLACPICAGSVNKYVSEPEMQPVICIDCGTLYHKLCWRQNGGKCAVLGCNSVRARAYSDEVAQAPIMTLSPAEIRNAPRQASNPLKQGRRRTQIQPASDFDEQRSVFGRFVNSFLRALGFRQ